VKDGPVKARRAKDAPVKSVWRRGRPDMTLPMPMGITLPAGKTEDTQEFVLDTAGDRDRFVAAADLLPGNPAIVHDAVIFVRSPEGVAAGREHVLAAWLPGSVPVTAGAGVGFLWRAGEQLAVRIHYKKTWKFENKAAADRSTVGLYLMNGAGRELRSLEIPASGAAIDEDAQALGVVVLGSADAPRDGDVRNVRIEAVRPDGSRVPVIGFAARAGWDQRYWLARPLALPKGTRLDVNVVNAVNDVNAVNAVSAAGAGLSSLRLSIDLVRPPS
jgi:hypothetical protein